MKYFGTDKSFRVSNPLFFGGFYLLIAFFLEISISARAQEEPALGHLQLIEVDKKVRISITFEAGTSCDGIQIFRSQDGIDFKEIGEIPGICGDPEFSKSFFFVDENPVKNTPSFYQVVYGRKIKSEIKTIQLIQPGDAGFLSRYLPDLQSLEVLFKNPQKERYEIFVYGQNGNLIFNASSTESSFLLPSYKIPSGWYVFTLRSQKSGADILGKLILK